MSAQIFRRVLLTGGGGFIGSHLVGALRGLYPESHVTVIDNFITGQRRNLQRWLTPPDNPPDATAPDDTRSPGAIKDDSASPLTLVEHDLTDQPWLTAWLESQPPFSLILHFASPASPPRYQAEPVLTYLVNSVVTHHLVQYAHRTGARLLFASTSEVYGDPLEHPQRETYWGHVNPNGPRSCYDEAKRLGETICGVHWRDFGVDTRLVRIFNTYGPQMDPEDGRVIPQFCMQALRGEPITVYGDGTQTRSFCYVEDLVNGILRLAERDDLAGETINIGNPTEFTLLELVTILERVLGQTLQIEHHPLPVDDPTRRRPDIAKAQRLLHWQPTISLEQGLHPTLSYFRQVLTAGE